MIALSISHGCIQRHESNGIPISVDVGSRIDIYMDFHLSQFAKAIDYIPLQTHEKNLFSGVFECDVFDSIIIINDITKCLLYDTEGRYMANIGSRGRGPGEYNYISNVAMYKGEKVFIQSLNDLIIYRADGEFVGKLKNFFLFNGDYIYSWELFEDSLFFGHIPNSTGQKKYKAVILNESGNLKKQFSNYIYFNRVKELASPREGKANIYYFKENLTYKEVYNDTLFYLTKGYQLIPQYVFNFGKYSEPLTHRENKVKEKDLGYLKEWSDYLYLENIFQTNQYLFLDCIFNEHFPAKRFTSRIISGVNMYYNTVNALGIFDKYTDELVFCKPTATDNPLITSGFCNDIDAGPRFYPNKQVNDSTMVMWMEAKLLKDHIASLDFKNSVPKYPNKKKELEVLASSIKESDNPILMMVTFKK